MEGGEETEGMEGGAGAVGSWRDELDGEWRGPDAAPRQLLADLYGDRGPEAQLAAAAEARSLLRDHPGWRPLLPAAGPLDLEAYLRPTERYPADCYSERLEPAWLTDELLPALGWLAASPDAPTAARCRALASVSEAAWDDRIDEERRAYYEQDLLGEPVATDLLRLPTAGRPETGQLLCLALDYFHDHTEKETMLDLKLHRTLRLVRGCLADPELAAMASEPGTGRFEAWSVRRSLIHFTERLPLLDGPAGLLRSIIRFWPRHGETWITLKGSLRSALSWLMPPGGLRLALARTLAEGGLPLLMEDMRPASLRRPAAGEHSRPVHFLRQTCEVFARLLDPAGELSRPVRRDLAHRLRRLGMDEQAPHLPRFYGLHGVPDPEDPDGGCDVRRLHRRYRDALQVLPPDGPLPPYYAGLPSVILIP